MPFQSGRVSFSRFLVSGDAPAAVDDAVLATLAENSFHEAPIGAPEEIETGWVTGQHLLDTQFTFDKNGYGPTGGLLLMALRIDTHSVPPEIKHAYRRVNEQALAAENPSGFASKAQKREAADAAGRQLREDLAAGKYRRSKMVPVLWDLQGSTVYCGSGSNKALEQLANHFFKSFNVRLEALTSGALAGKVLRGGAKGRDYEDLRPSPFTRPPDAPTPPAPEGEAPEDEGEDARPHGRATPSVPWLASAMDVKDFLGNEFLLWLWWKTEIAEGLIEIPAGISDAPKRDISILFDKSLDTDCAWGVLGKQTLRGTGPTKMAEAAWALATGKWPRKAGLIVAESGGNQWELALQGDRWAVSGATLPDVPEARTPRELIEARLMLTRQLANTVDDLFRVFVKGRVSGAWASERQKIRRWIAEKAK